MCCMRDNDDTKVMMKGEDVGVGKKNSLSPHGGVFCFFPWLIGSVGGGVF